MTAQQIAAVAILWLIVFAVGVAALTKDETR